MSHSGGLRGAERALLDLVGMLFKMRVECCVVVPYRGPLYQELKNQGVPAITTLLTWWMGSPSPITSHRVRRLFTGPSIVCRTIRTVLNVLTVPLIVAKTRLWRCDIVYTNTQTVCVGALAAWLVRRPHVWHIHEFGLEDFGLVFDLGKGISLRLMNQLSSMILVNSEAVAVKFAPYFDPTKVRLVYQSVVITREHLKGREVLPVPADTAIRCIVVGSLHSTKGQEDAVLAIGELRRLGLRPLLWVVGPSLDHAYEKKLHDHVKDLELEESVKFLGTVDNAFDAIVQANVLLMCSRHEAFGRVTVEGMLAGKPVIGARSAGTLELIRDGFNGLLYTPGDYRELATKISYLHEHPNEAYRMGENGREWAKARFGQARFAEQVRSLLDSLLQERREE